MIYKFVQPEQVGLMFIIM